MVFETDGSGTIEFEMSMNGETLEMLMLMGAGESDEETNLNSITDQFPDTTIVFYDMIPDSLRNEIDPEGNLKNWVMNFHLDSISKSISVLMDISFKSLAEFRNTMKTLSQIGEDDASSDGFNSSQFGSMIDTSFNWEPGHISWGAADLSNNPEYKSLMEEMGGEEGAEAMGLLEMFLGDLTFNMTVITPGLIYKCECPYGKANGNKVTMSYKIMDVMKNLEDFNQDTHIYYRVN